MRTRDCICVYAFVCQTVTETAGKRILGRFGGWRIESLTIILVRVLAGLKSLKSLKFKLVKKLENNKSFWDQQRVNLRTEKLPSVTRPPHPEYHICLYACAPLNQDELEVNFGMAGLIRFPKTDERIRQWFLG